MFIPTNRNLNIISIVISIIIFLLINIFVLDYKKMSFEVSFNSPEMQEKSETENQQQIENINEKMLESKEDTNLKWMIEIPEIGLVAEIAEGTTTDVMNKFVGHFEETQLEYGNIGLAAHNRGYPVNYFQDLKKLKDGSEIIYKHGDFKMTYIVKTIEIIENTNWNYLENTEDNRITLITCVENEPKYRRCIQGVENIEREE